jgi:murE/murF fusion protein
MLQLTTPEQAVAWLRGQGATGLCVDSRQAKAGDAFIAWPGAVQDGRQFVGGALANGAVACLVEAQGADAFALQGVQIAGYLGLKRDTGTIAAQFYAEPSGQLPLVAVTGTNGKTSTAWWLAQALCVLPTAVPCGVIGTLGVGAVPLPGEAVALAGVRSTGLTTPDPVTLQKTLRTFVDAGLKACAMEASSIGLEEQRMAGAQVRVAVFTNFTQDHLDYHGSMEAYWQAKRGLFDREGLQAAVINVDDSKGAELAMALQGTALDVWTVSCRQSARITACEVRLQGGGLHFTVNEGAQSVALQTHIIGDYNVSNLLGVIAAMRALGVPLADAVQACSQLKPVPGRMECVGGEGQPLVAVDYAHTPDALAQVLAAVRPLAEQRGGRLWCVFGCGGDRDASKRPLMGAIAARTADHVVVTSDNPRSEKPETIVAQILLGIADREHVDVEVDRARAIAASIGRAQAQDVIVIAGKGHESTQEQSGVKTPFSDMAHATQALVQRSPVFVAQEVAAMLPGSQLAGNAAAAAARVHTDTRTIAVGDLFVALKGERFDANTLLAQAVEQGASIVVCHRDADVRGLSDGVACIHVDDTRVALQVLATAWRKKHGSVRLIGVTGSNGKTTVTQMIASILRAHCGADSLATQGNLNNDIGVPLTVLGLRTYHRMAVVEMGMNHPGEIAQLAAIAQPDVVLVNNAQREHLEFMHTVEAVARENGSAIQFLGMDGVAVFPAADTYTPLWQSLAGTRKVLLFGNAVAGNGVALQSAQWGAGAWQVQALWGTQEITLHLHIAGRHNVMNALAAAACALAAGVPLAAVEQGLCAFEPVKGRSRALTLEWDGVKRTLVDDTYNANPDSVRAAIDVLAELPGPRLLVLGDMGEVGDNGPQFHAEVASFAQARAIEHVFLLGSLARHGLGANSAARHFETVEELITAVHAQASSVHSILVKGSRFMRMERIVQALQGSAGNSAGVRA